MRKVFEWVSKLLHVFFLKHVVSTRWNHHDIAYQNVYNQKYIYFMMHFSDMLTAIRNFLLKCCLLMLSAEIFSF